MTAYYNEIDPYCAQWLRNLIAAGEIPAGDVDERPIEEVSADDVKGYTQCHWFAGIGGWGYAARLAGWPDDRPLWTGSCPCQPFSNAGKRLAYDDPRNLWPHFARLIADCRPSAVAGEQVASKAGRLWLAGVRADLEALGYGVGAADLCAAGVGAPHIRQRLWWVGHTEELRDGSFNGKPGTGVQSQESVGGSSVSSRLGHTLEPGLEGHAGDGDRRDEPGREPADAAGPTAETGGDCGVEQPNSEGRSARRLHVRSGRSHEAALLEPWAGAEWIGCADGKARRIEPGIEPLVNGFPGRVDQVRAYGNSIVPQVAAEVLMAFMEST